MHTRSIFVGENKRALITAEHLGRRFGDAWGVRDIHLAIEPSECVGILGRNGAGKTTFVRLLTGQLKPTEGRITIKGLDVASRPLALRKLLGVMPETTALLDGLTGGQYLGFAGRLHGLEHATLADRIQELGHLLEIDFLRATPIAEYSFGMKKKTALASSLLHSPQILVLDEPFEGLDPVASNALQGLLSELHRRGTTILMTSHLLERAQQLCSRFIIIDQGRVAVDGQREVLEEIGGLEALFLRTVGSIERQAPAWM